MAAFLPILAETGEFLVDVLRITFVVLEKKRPLTTLNYYTGTMWVVPNN